MEIRPFSVTTTAFKIKNHKTEPMINSVLWFFLFLMSNIIAASLLQRYIRLLPVISSLHCRRLHPKTAYGSRHSIVDRSLPYNNHEMQSAVFLIQTAVDDKGCSFHNQNAASASMSPFFLSFSSSCLYHNFRARESFPSNLILYYKYGVHLKKMHR